MKKFNLERSVLVCGEITHETVSSSLPILAKLDAKPHRDGIQVYLVSPGGAATPTLALYDFLKTCTNRVTVCGMGECSSAAILLLQAADLRLLMPHTRLLLHAGKATIENSMTASDLTQSGREIGRLDAIYSNVLLEKMYQKVAAVDRLQVAYNLQEMLRNETYITADEAVNLGLADEIIYRPSYIEAALKRRK